VNQIATPDDSIGGIRFHPTSTWRINLNPGMSRTATYLAARLGIEDGNVKTAGNELRREAKRAHCLDHQQGKIPTSDNLASNSQGDGGMARMLFTTFFMKANPEAALLPVSVANVHAAVPRQHL
jgi:hypothetical protein